LARTGFEWFTVFAEDRSEPDVCQLRFGLRMPATERCEKLTEVKLLATVGDVNNLVGVPSFQPVHEGRQIGGGIIEPTVLFLNDERVGGPLTLLVNQKGILLGRQRMIRQNSLGASADGGNPGLQDLLDHGRQA